MDLSKISEVRRSLFIVSSLGVDLEKVSYDMAITPYILSGILSTIIFLFFRFFNPDNKVRLRQRQVPHELRHFLVLLHLKGVISKGCEDSQRDCLYPWLFRIEPFLRAHKKLLVPGQSQINQSVVLHRILPFIV